MGIQRTTILIVEDDPAVVEQVSLPVRAADWNIDVVRSVQDGWRYLQKKRPQLVLLGWRLPELNGMHLLSLIRNDNKLGRTPVIMLTAKDTEDDLIAALEHGADDYMTKPFSERELIARIRALIRRRSPEYSEKKMVVGIVTLDPVQRVVSVAGVPVKMWHAEFKLLKFLMAHPDQAFSRRQLLDKVWNNDEGIDERSVDVHIMRLRKAIHPAGNLIRAVRGIGYLLSEK